MSIEELLGTLILSLIGVGWLLWYTKTFVINTIEDFKKEYEARK